MTLTTGLLLLAVAVFTAIILITLRDQKKRGSLSSRATGKSPAFTRYTEWNTKRNQELKEPVLAQPKSAMTQESIKPEPNLPDRRRTDYPVTTEIPVAPVPSIRFAPLLSESPEPEISELETPEPGITEQILHQKPAPTLSKKNKPDKTLDSLQSGNNNLSLDYIAYIPGHETLPRQEIWSSYRQNEYLLEKSHQLFGYNPSSQTWLSLEHDSQTTGYTDLAITLQLADANGAASESELTRFTQLVLRLAEQFSRRFQFVDTFEEAQARAHQLDSLRQRFDILLVLNIVPLQECFHGPEIEHCAEYAGLQMGIDRVFDYPPAAPVFSMANLYNPGFFESSTIDQLECRGLTLFLRIPVVTEPLQQFEIMVNKTKMIADALHGNLVDEHLEPLSDRGTHMIYQQLSELLVQMKKIGIKPGDEIAKRLF